MDYYETPTKGIIMIRDIRWAHSIRQQVLVLDKTLLDQTLLNSRGTDTMTEQDMKISIIALRGLVQTQGDLIDAIYKHLMETPAKTPWYKKIFRK